jgi:hypothetical protein
VQGIDDLVDRQAVPHDDGPLMDEVRRQSGENRDAAIESDFFISWKRCFCLIGIHEHRMEGRHSPRISSSPLSRGS